MVYKIVINFASDRFAEKQFEYSKLNAQGLIRVDAEGSLVFNYLKIKEVPKFLASVLIEQGWGAEHTGFLKGPIYEERFDEPNLDIKVDEVEIYDIFNKTKDTISKSNFYLLAINYAHKALESVTWFDLLEREIVDKEWVNQVKQWIIENEDNILKMQEGEKA